MKVEIRCLMDGLSKNNYWHKQPSSVPKKKRENLVIPGRETDDTKFEEEILDKNGEKKDTKGSVIDDFFLSDYPLEDSEEY